MTKPTMTIIQVCFTIITCDMRKTRALNIQNYYQHDYGNISTYIYSKGKVFFKWLVMNNNIAPLKAHAYRQQLTLTVNS